TAFRRFDAFPNDHQNYVGNIALGTPKAALKPLEEADLVIGMGTRFTEVTTNGYDYPKPETPIIHVAASTEIAGVWGAKVTPIVAGVDKFLADFGANAGQSLS